MPHYIVTGRIVGDDEDSIRVTECVSAEEALRQFEVYLWENSDAKEPDEEVLEEVVVTYVIECDSKPRILATPWGWESSEVEHV